MEKKKKEKNEMWIWVPFLPPPKKNKTEQNPGWNLFVNGGEIQPRSPGIFTLPSNFGLAVSIETPRKLSAGRSAIKV